MFSYTRKQGRDFLLFVIPAFLLYTVFVIGPAISSIYFSFTSWDGVSDATMKFVGLKNFIEIFQSERAFGALWHTVFIAAMFTVLANILALILAIIVDNVRVGRNTFRSIFYIPVLISGVISGFIWAIMFNYSFGVINTIFKLMQLDFLMIDWLGKSPNALFALIIPLIWQQAGYYMIIYLAGLQGIPVELLEASTIDGAGRWHQFCYVTFPLLAGSLTVNLTLALIYGLRVFDQVAVITGGGPGFDTETITYLIYNVAFSELRQGYGTALAILLFALILVFAVFQVKFLRSREVQM